MRFASRIQVSVTASFLTIVSVRATTDSPVVPVEPAMEKYGDRRLGAIAKHPSLLSKIDQRQAFTDEKQYQGVLDSALARPRLVLPDMFKAFSSQAFSICPADTRVFFQLNSSFYTILGSVPIEDQEVRSATDGAPPEQVVLWVMPNRKSPTDLLSLWDAPQWKYADSTWITKVLKETLLTDTMKSGPLLRSEQDAPLSCGVVIGHGKVQRKAQLLFSGNVLQVSFDARSDFEKSIPRKQTMGSQNVLRVLPKIANWPPLPDPSSK